LCYLQAVRDLPTHADVVVIGGGSLGNSTLYHLGKMGVKAVLLEKDQLTAGKCYFHIFLWRLLLALSTARLSN
jgi:sarcosine dehydrogenase